MSDDRKTAGFAFPATSCTPYSIYSRFDLILELDPIAAILDRGFIPSTPDAAKCEVVRVSCTPYPRREEWAAGIPRTKGGKPRKKIHRDHPTKRGRLLCLCLSAAQIR
jgi:hypothetical protein